MSRFASRLRTLLLCGLITPAAYSRGAAPPAITGEPYFQLVEGTEALANGVVSTLAQDAHGLLWIGTPEGLWSWDGHRLEGYRHLPDRADSLVDDYVRALAPTPDGGLWVATQRPTLSFRAAHADGFQRVPLAAPGLVEDPASRAPVSLLLCPSGTLWVGMAEGGLLRRDPVTEQFDLVGMPAGAPGRLAHATVRALLLDRRGDLWLGTGDGLARLPAAQQRLAAPVFDQVAVALAGQYIYALFEAADGRIWVGTQAGGAAVVDPASGVVVQRWPVASAADPEGLSHAWVDGFAEPLPGQLWVTTFGGGVDVLAPERGVVLQRLRHDPAIPGSLALDRVIAPLKDRSGLLWIGSWGAGLQWHNPLNTSTFKILRHSPARPSVGLGHATVMGLAERADGSWWIGSGGGGITVLDAAGKRLAVHAPDPGQPGGLPDGTVRALFEDARGRLWVGTQAGLLRHDASAGFVDPGVRLPDLRIRRLAQRANGQVLVGTQRGLFAFDPADPAATTIEFRRQIDGQPLAAPVWSVLEDRKQRLWVATPDALYLAAPGTDLLRRLSDSGDAPVPAPVSDLRLAADGRLWVLAASGLYRVDETAALDAPRFLPWRSRDGLRVPRACGRELQSDRTGTLWTPRCRIAPASGELLSFGRADGVEIGNVELGASLPLKDGRLLFGGTRGLLLLDPAAFQPWSYQAPLLLTGVRVDGRNVPLVNAHAAGVQLPTGQSRLEVEFAALDFTAPQHLAYRYRLEGRETGWNSISGEQRQISYSGLWPGTYRLQVQVLNRLGQPAPQQLDLSVRVRPAWWQHMLTLLAVPLLLIGGLVGAVRWRTARIARRAVELEHQVNARTAELNQSRLKAEEALAELQRTQGQLVAAEKMAALGQLVAGVAHEINTPVGIAVTAASHLDDVVRRHGARLEAGQLSRQDLNEWQRTSAEATRLIVSSLERASTLVKSFKQVAVDQSSEQRRSFALGPFLHEVRDALAPVFKRSPHILLIDPGPPDLLLDSFPGALFQVLANLVNNALLHGFADLPGHRGEMRIRVETSIPDRVQIHFSDNGAGMSPEVLSRACDPFFTTRRGGGGSGLGLHLVHNLTTQLLGGQITLHSRPGHGTTVRLDLPRVAP